MPEEPLWQALGTCIWAVVEHFYTLIPGVLLSIIDSIE